MSDQDCYYIKTINYLSEVFMYKNIINEAKRIKFIRKGYILIFIILFISVVIQLLSLMPKKLDINYPAVILRMNDNKYEVFDTTHVKLQGDIRKPIIGADSFIGNLSIDYFMKDDNLNFPTNTKYRLNLYDNKYYLFNGFYYGKKYDYKRPDWEASYDARISPDFSEIAIYWCSLDNNELYIISPANTLDEAEKIMSKTW